MFIPVNDYLMSIYYRITYKSIFMNILVERSMGTNEEILKFTMSNFLITSS